MEAALLNIGFAMETLTARMDPMRSLAPLMFQPPAAAQKSFSVPMDDAFWTFTTAMVMTTAETGPMNPIAHPINRADLGNLCATVDCVSTRAGAVMEMQTAMISPMRGTARPLCVQLNSSAAARADASDRPGDVTVKMTALIIAMRWDVKKLELHNVLRTSSCVVMAAASGKGNSAMESMTVAMAATRAHIKTADPALEKRTATTTMEAAPRSARPCGGSYSVLVRQGTSLWRMVDRAKM